MALSAASLHRGAAFILAGVHRVRPRIWQRCQSGVTAACRHGQVVRRQGNVV